MRSFLFIVSLIIAGGCLTEPSETAVDEAPFEMAAEICDWGHCGQQYNCAQNPAPKVGDTVNNCTDRDPGPTRCPAIPDTIMCGPGENDLVLKKFCCEADD